MLTCGVLGFSSQCCMLLLHHVVLRVMCYVLFFQQLCLFASLRTRHLALVCHQVTRETCHPIVSEYAEDSVCKAQKRSQRGDGLALVQYGLCLCC